MGSRWKLLVVWGVSLALTVGLCGAISLAQEGPECTITVQPGESIQAAIDRAPEGAVICLAEGEWEENIVIEKSITLRGEGAQRSVIRWAKEGGIFSVVWIGSAAEIQVHIERLTVTKGCWYPGIIIWGSAQVTITESTVSKNSSGIEIGNWAQATITGSTISENSFSGIVLADWAQATITGSIVSKNEWDGIVLADWARATITGSTISENGDYGITVVDSARGAISESTVSGNELGGIMLGASSQATITGSAVSGNRLDGIILAGSSQATIEANEILGNGGYGVALLGEACFGIDVFTGYVIGRGNIIPGPGEPNGNEDAAICPDELSFLMTEEGGELDRRE